MKKLISILFILAFALSLCSCAASKSEVAPGYYMEVDRANSGDGSFYASKTSAESDGFYNKEEAPEKSPVDTADEYSQKLIKREYMTLETLDYESGIVAIEQLVKKYGGYFASSKQTNPGIDNYYSRTASYEIRVPSGSLETFVDEISGQFNVTRAELVTDDITDTYYNLKAQYESLVAQEARLMELLEKASTLSELITIDDKLTSVRAEINYTSSRIQYYSKAVDMSFVNITLYEVKRYEVSEPTFGQKIVSAIKGSFEAFASFSKGFVIVIIWVLPFAVLAGAIAVAVIFIIKKKKKNKQ